MSDLAIMFDEATETANGDLGQLVNELKKITAQLTHTINIDIYEVIGLYNDWRKAQVA